MIRKEQEQDDESSHEAIESFHRARGYNRALITSTTELSSLIQLGPIAGGTMDSDDNYSSPDDEGDQDDEGDDKKFSNKNVSSHLSLDASSGGAIDRLANFPLKLHKMLERAEIEGFHTTVSWLQPPNSGTEQQATSSNDNMDGRRTYTPFKVHNPDKFVQDVIPRFFQMTKFKSFLRQLNIWGFSRDRSKGALNGSYYHKDFVREDPDLCQKMRRTKNKGMYKRGTKGSSPLSKSITRSPTKIGSSIATSFLGKDGVVVASNSEDSKRAGSSVSTTRHSANEIGTSTHPDLASLLNRDFLTMAARNDSAPFPIAYRPTMRGMERQHDQFFGGDLPGHADSRQILDGLSSHQQQIFLRGGTEASMLSEFSLSAPTISGAARTSSVTTKQDTIADRQNALVFPPPLPTPSSREMSPRILAQGGTSSYASATHPSSRPMTNWSHGRPEGGERQGDVLSLNVARGQSNTSTVPPGSVVGESWRSGPFVSSSRSSASSLRDIATSSGTAGAMPRSDKIAQLLTNPQMASEDLKYILVGFQLGAANKEEDDQSHADSSSALCGVVGKGMTPTEEQDEDEADSSPMQRKRSTSR